MAAMWRRRSTAIAGGGRATVPNVCTANGHELVERSFEHVLDDGGMRRVHLRGRENITKRYLIHTAAFNLGLIMRKLTGFGTPKGWADARRACFARILGIWAVLERSCRVLCRPLAAFGDEHRFHVTGLTHDARGFPTMVKSEALEREVTPMYLAEMPLSAVMARSCV